MATYSEIFRKVSDELTRRRDAAIAEQEANLARLHTLSPEAAELDKALSGTAMRIFAAATSGEDVENKVKEIRRENEELLAERRKLLSALGLPADYTEPHYTCPKCADTGYVLTDMCTCFRDRIRMETLLASGVTAEAEHQTFDTFSLDYYRESEETLRKMEQNLAAARAFADEFKPGKENLLLMGGTGLGKTHLSTAIARRVIERGYDVVYETVGEVFSDFEYDRFRNGYSAEPGRAEKYLTASLLILDDLGTEFSSAFTVSCLYQLVNTRGIRGLSTVVSTNLTPEELNARYDQRLTSRFFGNYRILQFSGSDIRFQKLLGK